MLWDANVHGKQFLSSTRNIQLSILRDIRWVYKYPFRLVLGLRSAILGFNDVIVRDQHRRSYPADWTLFPTILPGVLSVWKGYKLEHHRCSHYLGVIGVTAGWSVYNEMHTVT
jgi:hypothetical protein